MVQGPSHQIVPVFTRTGLDDPVFLGLRGQAHAGHFYFQHERFDVPSQHDVAAAAQHLPGQGGQLRVGQHGAQIAFAAHPQQHLGFGGNAKRVVGLQGDIFLQVHGRIVALTTSGFHHHAYF